MLQFLSIPVFGFLDRWGGGGFEFLGIKTGPLSRGLKAARRYGIPALAILLTGWSWETLLVCAAVGGLLSLSNKDIAEQDYVEIGLKSLAIALLLHSIGWSWWVFLIPVWWTAGVYLSNVGLNGWKLGWHWVELGRGIAIGLSRVL